MSLTKATIEAAQSEAHSYRLPDGRDNLYLRVMPSGRKVWVVRPRHGNRQLGPVAAKALALACVQRS